VAMRQRQLAFIVGSVCACALMTALAASTLAAGDANSEAGCPNEASPGFRVYLPDCRAYEMVTPPYKQGYQVFGTDDGLFSISRDGERVLGETIGALAGTEDDVLRGTSNFGASFYTLTRTSEGWHTTPLDPPASEFPEARFLEANTELDASLWLLATRVEGEETFSRREGDGTFVAVGPQAPPGVFRQESDFTFFGASSNLARLVYGLRAPVKLSEEGNGDLFPGDTTLGQGREGHQHDSLYEYSGTGGSEAKLVGVSNAGALRSNSEAQLISQCGIELGSNDVEDSTPGDLYNAISSSGDAVFFTAQPHCSASEKVGSEEVTRNGSGPEVRELYARINGSQTVALSEPALPAGACRSGEPCFGAEHKEGVFQGASENGESVFFLSEQPLVNGAPATGEKLYEARLEGGHVAEVVDVAAGPAPEVLGVARVSEDGSRVYFVARSVLTTAANANEQAPVAGKPNLYVFEPGTGRTAFVGTLAEGDEADWSTVDARPVQATTDGGFLVFASRAHVTQDDTSGEEVAQLFEYDAQTEQVVRVSRGQVGSYLCSTTGIVEEGYNCDGNTAAGPAPSIRIPFYYASDSGPQAVSGVDVTGNGTVYFASALSLTPQAINGYPNASPGFKDVYEYRDGNVYLISDGQQVTSSVSLQGSAVEGRDVLFTTVDSLVPQDTDTQVDLYDARVEGGFPAPAAFSECLPDACQGPLNSTPPFPSTGSSSQAPEGNLPAPVSKIAKPKPKHLTRVQELARALKGCQVKLRGHRRRRASCEVKARKVYGGNPRAKKTSRRAT
jgi:hypothetical protein